MAERSPGARPKTGEIAAPDLHARLREGGELALLDVREEGPFARGHLFQARSMPLGRLELVLPGLVPRRTTPIVLADGGEGLAEKARGRLAGIGYDDVKILAGGIREWSTCGYVLFSGVNVPSKAFGEYIEHRCATPSITASELRSMIDKGRDLLILDARPFEEYQRMAIPGGIDMPGAELVYRVHDLVAGPDTLVVVNCAGRTRSIIGAQSLRNAGLENEVVALRNGTMGWELSGFEPERGADRMAAPPSGRALGLARARAARVAEAAGVRRLSHGGLADFRHDTGRTTYLLDVRGTDEYEAGHLEGAISAPGGQLVQATDRYVGTLGARLVLVDDDGVRAPMTASWLRQMGFDDVFVLEDAFADQPLETGPRASSIPPLEGIDMPDITPDEAAALLAKGAVAADFASSTRYAQGHIPGAWFVIRSRLDRDAPRLPRAETYIATSGDGALARLAGAELARATGRAVLVLAGGTEAWAAAGLPLADGLAHMASEPDDVWRRPYEETGREQAAMADYLAWEVALPGLVARDGTARFRAIAP